MGCGEPFRALPQCPRRFPRTQIPVNIKVTSTRLTGNPEKIAVKEVTSGRYHQDRRQAGTQEDQARSPQGSGAQSAPHRRSRREEEEGQEAGPRRVEALIARRRTEIVPRTGLRAGSRQKPHFPSIWPFAGLHDRTRFPGCNPPWGKLHLVHFGKGALKTGTVPHRQTLQHSDMENCPDQTTCCPQIH